MGKGRLTDEEIKRMVEEAEKYAAEDEANKLRIEAKNGLENYAYQMKSTMGDEKLAGKLSDDDKASVNGKIDEVISWLESNQMAEKEEYEAKQKELEGVVNRSFRTSAAACLEACQVVCLEACQAECQVECQAECLT